MISILFTVSVGLLLKTCLANVFGPGWGSGPVHPYKTNSDGTFVPDPNAASNNKIIFATGSMVLPETPKSKDGQGNDNLWMGLGTYHLPRDRLIQGLAFHFPSSQNNDPGVTGGITSPDGGKTWVSKKIHLPAHEFTTF
ncbi:hypothetical protein EJ03DRAFT_327150 [Teratosphaeria nubilosa]|uniref:Uncharacterized protein n=1 Tax=Teratosphaeria nubilosa TaxID=161662 RepID=A0A6G1LB43_9PEZI|nr:hypothetical protein EJ03DRAFT_327150 [Teratosphaeria nubilosa]